MLWLLQSATVLMALLQPAPEVYDLFDEVLLMSEGAPQPCLPAQHCSACTSASASIRVRAAYFPLPRFAGLQLQMLTDCLPALLLCARAGHTLL